MRLDQLMQLASRRRHVDLGEEAVAARQLLLGGVLKVRKTLLHDRRRCNESASIVSGLATVGNVRAGINQCFPKTKMAGRRT
jgi:hypothetical protein